MCVYIHIMTVLLCVLQGPQVSSGLKRRAGTIGNKKKVCVCLHCLSHKNCPIMYAAALKRRRKPKPHKMPNNVITTLGLLVLLLAYFMPNITKAMKVAVICVLKLIIILSEHLQ